MDTSEQYIKMCDCPEIQNGYLYDNGDFFFDTKKKDVGVFHGKLVWLANLDMKENKIWLPRQDQIQKMMKYLSLWELMYGFWKYIQDLNYLGTKPDEYLIKNFNSMEQLWLAFYMKEKHNKVWDEDRWVKLK